jgi:hypothetical protein
MSARYSAEERELIKSLVNEGAVVADVLQQLPNKRTIKAISQEVKHLDYGIKNRDGVMVFYKGINKREVNQTLSAVTDKPFTPTVERFKEKSAVIIAPSTLTKPNVGLEINTQAISILQDYKLQINSNSIFELSKFIVKNKIKDVSCTKNQ